MSIPVRLRSRIVLAIALVTESGHPVGCSDCDWMLHRRISGTRTNVPLPQQPPDFARDGEFFIGRHDQADG